MYEWVKIDHRMTRTKFYIYKREKKKSSTDSCQIHKSRSSINHANQQRILQANSIFQRLHIDFQYFDLNKCNACITILNLHEQKQKTKKKNRIWLTLEIGVGIGSELPPWYISNVSKSYHTYQSVAKNKKRVLERQNKYNFI